MLATVRNSKKARHMCIIKYDNKVCFAINLTDMLGEYLTGAKAKEQSLEIQEKATFPPDDCRSE